MTETRLRSGHLASKQLVAAVVLFALALGRLGAQPVQIASAQPGGHVIAAYIDRLGDFYVELEDHTIVKYDFDGGEVGRYEPPDPPSLFDPANGLREFIYTRNCRCYTQLDRGLAFISTDTLSSAFAIDPYLACPGYLNALWILDRADWSLKKIDTKASRVMIDTRLDPDTAPSIVTMREYQNYIFLLDSGRGVLQFNMLGIPTDTLPGHIPYFNFLGQELYYLREGELVFHDLYNGDERRMPLPAGTDIALLTDDRMLTIANDTLTFWRIPNK